MAGRTLDRLVALTARQNRQSPTGRRVPLALLRAPTGSRIAGADWKLEPDGVLGRVLEVSAGVSLSYPLSLGGEVRFTSRVTLYPHDWRDLVGAVRATVAVTSARGVSELWATTLHAGDRGRPGGRQLTVTVPGDATALHLTVSPLRVPPPGDPLERAIWVEPALWDPAGPPLRAPLAAEPATASSNDGPLFSVLVPVHDPPLQMLREAVESVGGQTLGDWELCLVDDGSRDPEVVAALEAYTVDPRIRLHRNATAQGISGATNAALELATGRYVALLDHDDTLAPDALEQVAAAITADPSLDMVYTDEDVVQDGVVLEPHPKPGWSPEHMAALMYTCHLGVYRRSLAVELGGFHTRFDGCQDFDFVLRLMEHTDRVAHVPQILYHWRAHPASTATFGGGAKPHAFRSQPAAIAEHLARTGIDAEVRYGYLPGIHRIVHRVPPDVPVAIALAATSAEGLTTALRSWLEQPHEPWRLHLVAPHTLHASLTRAIAEAGIGAERIELLAAADGATSAEMLARAADHAARTAAGGHVLILQSPAAGLVRDWLTRLVGYSAQPGVAAVGPVILGAEGSIAQAGVALPEGLPLHLLHDLPPVSAPPAVTNVSAVSGGLLTRAATLRELGGLDPVHRALALVDYCVRAIQSGWRIVSVPDARLKITGPDPTTNDLPAMWGLARRWATAYSHDPYFNAGYLADRGDLSMRPS